MLRYDMLEVIIEQNGSISVTDHSVSAIFNIIVVTSKSILFGNSNHLLSCVTAALDPLGYAILCLKIPVQSDSELTAGPVQMATTVSKHVQPNPLR